MVWVDTLLYLQQHTAPVQLWAEYLDLGLSALEHALDKWLADPQPNGDLKGIREVSYVFELLVRGQRLDPVSPKGQRLGDELIKASGTGRPDRLRMSLYYGLQLATHFPHQSQARAAVSDLIREARTQYESGSHSGQPDYFHSIVLRLLAAHHGETLRATIQEALWLRNRQAAARELDGAEQRQRLALTQLIHRHIHVHLGTVTRLSGTRTRAVVYRVQFSLQSEATDRDGHPFAIVPNSLQLIVKQGSIESLSRTLRRFNELPDHLRKYFAHHSDKAEVVGDEWYLIMEDLVGLAPLSEVLDRIDLRWAGRAEHDQLARVAAATATTLRALHQHDRRPPVATNELGWLYLNPIARSINTLCEPAAFPELKAHIETGFTANGQRYHPLNHYLATLQQHAGQLTPPAVSGVHGDCHSRNLLIDDTLTTVKFVDLETLTYTDDYLTDYGLLLEDLALYRYLPRGQRPDALTANDIHAGPDFINYPAIPRAADSLLYFQTCLLDQIAHFANEVSDPHYKPRLWLAIVRNLIQLIARQLPLTDLQRRDDFLKLSLVTYAEAARLLHELAQHLDGATLPELPFGGVRSQEPEVRS
jgi:hypothetical protein